MTSSSVAIARDADPAEDVYGLGPAGRVHVHKGLLDQRAVVPVRPGQDAEPREVTRSGLVVAGVRGHGVILPHQAVSVVENGRRDQAAAVRRGPGPVAPADRSGTMAAIKFNMPRAASLA